MLTFITYLMFACKRVSNFTGINRHFQMVFLHDKFNGALDRKISAREIWNHLMEMYDLNALVCCLHVYVVIFQLQCVIWDILLYL